MKVDYVNPFVEATFSVVETLLQVTPVRGPLIVRPTIFTTQEVSIVCGITGEIEGHVIYGMPMAVAEKIASLMLGQPVASFDQVAASAIAELGNMISANSISLLSGKDYACDITPPTVIRGASVKISVVDIPALVIPICLPDIGEIEVNVSLKERGVPRAA